MEQYTYTNGIGTPIVPFTPLYNTQDKVLIDNEISATVIGLQYNNNIFIGYMLICKSRTMKYAVKIQEFRLSKNMCLKNKIEV